MYSLISLFCLSTQIHRALSQVTAVPDHIEVPTPNPLYMPDLIVFDTDHLLWPYWLDIETRPPYRKNMTTGEVFDLEGKPIKLYPEVKTILKRLKQQDLTLAIASRCKDTMATKSLLELLELKKYFRYTVIKSGNKRFHFDKLRDESCVEFEDMLFYDAEARNIIATGRIGVPSILVRDGLDEEIFDEGLGRFAKMKQMKRKGPFPLAPMSSEAKIDNKGRGS